MMPHLGHTELMVVDVITADVYVDIDQNSKQVSYFLKPTPQGQQWSSLIGVVSIAVQKYGKYIQNYRDSLFCHCWSNI